MKLIDLVQRTPEWHRWREKGLSASNAAAFMGESPYQTRWGLWAQQRGLIPPPDLDDNYIVQRGVRLEDTVRERFEERHDTLVLPCCGEHDEHPVLRASFDGINDAGEPTEFKVPAPGTYAKVAAETTESTAFKLYWHQVQFQLAVCGAPRGWLVFDPCDPQVGPPIEFLIDRDDAFINGRLIPEALDFWDMVDKGKEPEKDPERDLFTPTGDAAAAWEADALRYRALQAEIERHKEALKTLEGEQKQITARCVAAMGDFVQADHTGLKVTRFSVAGTIDKDAALAALVPGLTAEMLEAFRKDAREQVKVTLQKGWTPPKADDPDPPPATPEPTVAAVSTVPAAAPATNPAKARKRKAPPSATDAAATAPVESAAASPAPAEATKVLGSAVDALNALTAEIDRLNAAGDTVTANRMVHANKVLNEHGWIGTWKGAEDILARLQISYEEACKIDPQASLKEQADASRKARELLMARKAIDAFLALRDEARRAA